MVIKNATYWRKIGIVCLLLGILLPLWSNFSCLGVGSEDTPQTEGITELRWDSILYFGPQNQTHSFNMTMRSNFVYRFLYECYIPNIEYNASATVIAPSEQKYVLWNYTHDAIYLYRDYSFDYGAAETGIHNITLTVKTAANLSIYLKVGTYRRLAQYYEEHVLMDSVAMSNDSLYYYFNETFAFNSALKTKYFTLDLEKDTEYWIDCFRTNPLTEFEKANKNFYFPNLTLNITLNNIFYPLYRNNTSLSTVFKSTENFHLRLGFPFSGIAKIDFGINASTLSLNFAFICYSVRRVGNGPEDPILPLNQTNTNNQTDRDSHLNLQNSSWLESMASQFESFTDSNLDIILIVGGGLVLLLVGINYYRVGKKSKDQKFTDLRE